MTYKLTHEQATDCIKRIRTTIQTYFRENDLEYAIFGKSEGLDSSVVAGLLSERNRSWRCRLMGLILSLEERTRTNWVCPMMNSTG